jgi:hypothetical protein
MTAADPGRSGSAVPRLSRSAPFVDAQSNTACNFLQTFLENESVAHVSRQGRALSRPPGSNPPAETDLSYRAAPSLSKHARSPPCPLEQLQKSRIGVQVSKPWIIPHEEGIETAFQACVLQPLERGRCLSKAASNASR